MRHSIKIIILILMPFFLNAQRVYTDHFGAGHNVSVTVTSSSEQNANIDDNTLNGSMLRTNVEGASRFLSQATLGANYAEMEAVAQTGIKNWLAEQFNMPPGSFWDDFIDTKEWAHTVLTTPNTDIVNGAFLSGTFYDKVLNDNDVLRNKVAFAYSQIFVVAVKTGNINNVANFYDLMYQNAFGNYRDILEEVTLSLAMGDYLSHFRNQKADLSNGKLPDENFAREIMQLFTVGLFELNNDGSLKLDNNGNPVPTYDIVDVQELAKVFTGLSGNRNFQWWVGRHDPTLPMQMYQEHHDLGQKVMLDGTVIPPNQPGMEDIRQALDVLFNHPNVGPFMAIRLIQNFVKSNPTPEYINRVASVFNNNGRGVRGDMKAVIEAILIDPEARNCAWINHPHNGKLIQPIERFTQLWKAFNVSSPSGILMVKDYNSQQGIFDADQTFMRAPSVFNFFSPFFAEQEIIEPLGLVSPEFNILNASTSMNYINYAENTVKIRPFENFTARGSDRFLTNNRNDEPFLDLSEEVAIIQNDIRNNIDVLLDRIDIIMCRGQLSNTTRQIIKNNILANENENPNRYTPTQAVEDILYFIMISPDYLIQK